MAVLRSWGSFRRGRLGLLSRGWAWIQRIDMTLRPLWLFLEIGFLLGAIIGACYFGLSTSVPDFWKPTEAEYSCPTKHLTEDP